MWDALTHARNRICGFARRHKKMVVFTGVTALCGAGAYYAYRKMLNETEKFGLQLQKQMAEHQILQYSMLKTQEESHAAVKRFIPSLKKRLYKILDLEQIVTSLKELDKNEKKKRNELWEEAKIIGITRYLTGTYAIALLHLLVFAQLSIMGRRSFEESAKKKHLQQLQGHSHNNNSTDSRPFLSGSNTAENSSGGEMDNHNEMKEKKEIINAAQHEFLASGIEYFLENGLEKLCIHVQKAVKKHETFMSWEVHRKKEVNADELVKVLQEIHGALSMNISSITPKYLAVWRECLIYSDKKSSQNEEVISLLNDLWDLYDSPLFTDALREVLDFTFNLTWKELQEAVYVKKNTQEDLTTTDTDAADTETTIMSTSISSPPSPPSHPSSPPLAKLIPQMKAALASVFQKTKSTTLEISSLPHFHTFAEAVFFQHDPEADGNSWHVI